jgi:hypothetical protein
MRVGLTNNTNGGGGQWLEHFCSPEISKSKHDFMI